MIRKSVTTGVSMMELIVLISITAIVVIVAVPSFVSFLQRNRVTVLAQNLYYNLQYARSEAIKRNARVYVTFTTGSNWCYGINATSACSCGTAGSCGLGATSATSSQATLTASGLSSGSVYFEPNHGAANVAPLLTYTVTSGSSAISVKVSLSGNIQTCSNNVSGYQACS